MSVRDASTGHVKGNVWSLDVSLSSNIVCVELNNVLLPRILALQGVF